jgi:hypothetical protein
LIELYEAWDKPEKAEQWRAKLPQTDAVGKVTEDIQSHLFHELKNSAIYMVTL